MLPSRGDAIKLADPPELCIPEISALPAHNFIDPDRSKW